ncbi:MAG: hypothetical protein KIS86_06480 [Devosia sp.]|nr:hypothetical protein [Devosia sp.]
MFRPVLLAALCLAALPALAQDYDPLEGLYFGHGEGELTLELTHIEDDRYAISIDTLVPMENDLPGCGGGVEGEVLLTKKGGNFFVENEFYVPDSPSPTNQRLCEIGLTFDGKGNLELEERSGCLNYHGAACGFSGTLVHEAAGI